MEKLFAFEHFTIIQQKNVMPLSTDAVLLGAWCIGKIKNISSALDVGSGTGILSLLLASFFPSCKIDAIDIQEEAFLNTSRNVSNSNYKDLIKPHCIDFKEMNPSLKYDLILCNPPYFKSSLLSREKQLQLARHENDASLSIKDFLHYSSLHLKETSHLAFILPLERHSEVGIYAAYEKLYIQNITKVSSKEGKDFTRVLYLMGKEYAPSFKVEHLYIEKKEGGYTNEFRLLCQKVYQKKLFINFP